MKQILFLIILIIIPSSLCERANNVDIREKDACPDFPDSSGSIQSVSDCVDYDLYNGERYYDKCCFARILVGGTYYKGCTGLTTEEVRDIPLTISMIEEAITEQSEKEGEKTYGKVYELNCLASYIHIFSLAATLLGLLF